MQIIPRQLVNWLLGKNSAAFARGRVERSPRQVSTPSKSPELRMKLLRILRLAHTLAVAARSTTAESSAEVNALRRLEAPGMQASDITPYTGNERLVVA